jgi:signal recognition particle subunit SRP54
MLGTLTDKMRGLIGSLAGKKSLTEENIQEAISQIRLALLEADVNYSVAKALIQRVKAKAVGEEVLKSVTAGQQFTKIVHDELVQLMGGQEALLELKAKPAVIMMCGLQGSGKTTHTVKLARFIQKEKLGEKILLAACDLQRPAAIEQLKTLASSINIPVFSLAGETDPIKVAKQALQKAKEEKFDVLIVDTAGRLHIDQELMGQLEAIKKVVEPSEILFVANAATGQDAVTVAKEFNDKIAITGSILSMLDGNTRGGAAISIREVTGKPLKFEGIGEGVDAIQVFNPASMADRILGMGDVINLVKKAKEHFDESQAEDLEKKFKTASFTYEDYLKQMGMMKKMGSFKSLLGMLPGMGDLSQLNFDESEMGKIESIILSMTPEERKGKDDLSIPRRKRIAKGSGTNLDAVNRLVKTFKRSKDFFKQMPNMKRFGGFPWQ